MFETKFLQKAKGENKRRIIVFNFANFGLWCMAPWVGRTWGYPVWPPLGGWVIWDMVHAPIKNAARSAITSKRVTAPSRAKVIAESLACLST